MGFANGYPKQIEISFTFIVDKIYEHRKDKTSAQKAQDTKGKIAAGGTNPKVNNSGTPATTEAGKAQAAKQAVGGDAQELATKLGGARIVCERET